MNSWTSGYVAEIGYIHGFYRELTPSLLHFVSLVRGQRAPDANASLNYCELACGQGFSANLLAAANPQIQFFATDFNPAHIFGARTLAAEAATTNIHFFDQSFAEFVDNGELPSFDIISLHGVYSWVSEENRRAIVEFIRRKLNPGGLVYISYNTLPGWAAMMPLRQLLVEHAHRSAGPIGARVQAALEFVSTLKQANPNFFRAYPGVGARLEKIKTQNRNYIAHEYFNRDWTPFYHSEVAKDLDNAKLTYLGSASILDNVDVVNLSSEQQKSLADIDDPVLRETVRDFMVNQQFRRDVFIKGLVPYSMNELQNSWADTRFCPTHRREDFAPKLSTVRGEVTLEAAPYSAVLGAFAEKPRTLRELTTDKAVAAMSWPRLREVMTVLVGMGQLQPALDVKNDVQRSRRVKVFNAAVLRRAESVSELGALASPITGGGVPLSRFMQLFLAAQIARHEDPVSWAWDKMRKTGQRLRKDGKILESDQENKAYLGEMFEEYLNKHSPALQHLGVS